MAELVAAAAGAAAGLLAAWLLLRQWARARAGRGRELWRATELTGVRRRAAGDGRGGAKDAVGADLRAGGGAALGALPFEAADARFVGDPVTFVVFDGHTEVKDRAGAELRGLSFVSVGTCPDGVPSAGPDGLLVAECVAGRRVEWLTLRLP